MGENSRIEWTDHTFSPWWGCTKVSPGCDNCYAERDARRYYPGKALWGVAAARRQFGDAHWNEPLRWNRRATKQGIRLRVFCASMADVFDKDGPAEDRHRLFRLIEKTPNLEWLVLTKRVGNVAHMMIDADFYPAECPNLWLGISVVNQQEADRDIPKLLELPVRIRFLSIEPMLAPVNLRALHPTWTDGSLTLDALTGAWTRSATADNIPAGIAALEPLPRQLAALDWVICGGESGHRARDLDPRWALSIAQQCTTAGATFFFKQGSQANWPHFKDQTTFPAALQRREWPQT